MASMEEVKAHTDLYKRPFGPAYVLRNLNPKGRYNSKAQRDSDCTGISCENLSLYGLLE